MTNPPADTPHFAKEWVIVKSKSDKHPECGYPHGAVLCRSKIEANEYIDKSPFKDLYMENFDDPNPTRPLAT